ncbi:BolA family transcriptional regulator [Bradyrhizobium sp. UFLA05-153]
MTNLAGTAHDCGHKSSKACAGKCRIQQHRMIHAAPARTVIDTVDTLVLQTAAPK